MSADDMPTRWMFPFANRRGQVFAATLDLPVRPYEEDLDAIIEFLNICKKHGPKRPLPPLDYEI